MNELLKNMLKKFMTEKRSANWYTAYHRNRHAKWVYHRVAVNYHVVFLQLHHYNDHWPIGTSFEYRVSYFFL